MTPQEISANHDFSNAKGADTTYSPNKIKVVGVGGGGNNAINHMYRMGVNNISFIVANTDRQALENSPVPTKVLLGPNSLKGRGAGNVPERAFNAAEESAEEIAELFDDDTDMVFITAGMGGGTGTGASPVIAKIAKEKGILTIGIVTIPFLFEGQKKILKALDGANEMRKYVDALLVINNERLSEIYRDYDFLNAFGKADDILAMAAMSISEIVTCEGYINLDFNDVDQTLRDGGTAIISTGYGEGENRVTKAIEDALHSPLLRNTDILGSRKLLFNLYYSRDADDKLKIDETNQITSFVSNIDPNVDVIWGVAFDNTLGDKVKFTILAAGFDVSVSEDGDRKIVGHEISDNDKFNDTQEMEIKRVLTTEYGEGMETYQRIKEEQRYIILQPDQLDDENVFDVLANNPAFNRDKKVISNLKNQNAGAAATASQQAPQQQQQQPKSGKNSIEFNDL